MVQTILVRCDSGPSYASGHEDGLAEALGDNFTEAHARSDEHSLSEGVEHSATERRYIGNGSACIISSTEYCAPDCFTGSATIPRRDANRDRRCQ
jgi:hypothetical protein